MSMILDDELSDDRSSLSDQVCSDTFILHQEPIENKTFTGIEKDEYQAFTHENIELFDRKQINETHGPPILLSMYLKENLNEQIWTIKNELEYLRHNQFIEGLNDAATLRVQSLKHDLNNNKKWNELWKSFEFENRNRKNKMHTVVE